MKILRVLLTAVGIVATAAWCQAAQPAKPLFNGKDLTGWKPVGEPGKTEWKIGKAALDPADPTKLVVQGAGTEMVACEKVVNLVSDEEFGDCVLEFEFMLSKNSNSGVKLMKIYEIQILDSYGKEKATASDCGAVYLLSPPKVNASAKPGEWQKMTIEFRAPRFDSQGNKTANAKFVRVVHNGKVVQENFEVPHGTNVSRNAKEYPRGAIYIQGDHGPVAFRNMTITQLD